MKRVLYSIVAVLLITTVVFVLSCNKDKEPDTGNVTGVVYSENGVKTIPGALIWMDHNDIFYHTYTDKNGSFELAIPEGTHMLYIQTGNGEIFRSSLEVVVEADQMLEIPNGSLKLHQAANLGYIAGLYDNIETIIIDSLGYTCTELFQSDLDNISTLQNYDAIFLNCGKTFNLDSMKFENLRTYVEGGGSIYASDFAVEYLTGDYGTKSYTVHGTPAPKGKAPCSSALGGGFIPDSILCTSTTGPATMVYNADIVDQDIITLLGKNTIDLEYDLSGWEVVSHYEYPWEVLVSDQTYGALALRMVMPTTIPYTQPPGNWITICHYPPGNTSNPITITINVAALPAHLAHGDHIGPCAGSGGTIIFTTFHNHHQGGLSDDVMRILEHFILNL